MKDRYGLNNGLESRVIMQLALAMPAAILGTMFVRRLTERWADKNSARKLKATAGGIAFFKGALENPALADSSSTKWPFLKRFLLSHPSLEKRIAWLEKMAEEQRNSK